MSDNKLVMPQSCKDFIELCKALREAPKFHPGDIVNVGKMICKQDEQPTFWPYLDKSTKLPIRYRVVGTTEEGLVYGVKLASSSSKAHVLNWHQEVRVDKEYMDMLIMDAADTFDAAAEMKAEKKKIAAIRKYNRNLAIKNTSPKELEDLFSSWEVGKQFWLAWSNKMEKPLKVEVVAKNTERNNAIYITVKSVDKNIRYRSNFYPLSGNLFCSYLFIIEEEPQVYRSTHV